MKNNTDLKLTEDQLIVKLVDLIHNESVSVYASLGFASDLDTWSIEYWSIESIDEVNNQYVIILHQYDEFLPTIQEFRILADKEDL